MATTYLSIGSNSGDREMNLSRSLELVSSNVGQITATSRIYESESWGYEGQNFLNMAIKVETCLSATAVLEQNRNIEKLLGRERIQGTYTDRTIDLDILFYDYEILHLKELTIPHPHLQDRLFVLLPMMDIEPQLIHPVLKKSITQLREECVDNGWINVFRKN